MRLRSKSKKRCMVLLLRILFIYFLILFIVYKLFPQYFHFNPVKLSQSQKMPAKMYIVDDENDFLFHKLSVTGRSTFVSFNSHFNNGLFPSSRYYSSKRKTSYVNVMENFVQNKLQSISYYLDERFQSYFWIYPSWLNYFELNSSKLLAIGRNKNKEFCFCQLLKNSTSCMIISDTFTKLVPKHQCPIESLDRLDSQSNKSKRHNRSIKLQIIQDLYLTNQISADNPLVISINIDYFLINHKMSSSESLLPRQVQYDYDTQHRTTIYSSINTQLNQLFCVRYEHSLGFIDYFLEVLQLSDIHKFNNTHWSDTSSNLLRLFQLYYCRNLKSIDIIQSINLIGVYIHRIKSQLAKNLSRLKICKSIDQINNSNNQWLKLQVCSDWSSILIQSGLTNQNQVIPPLSIIESVSTDEINTYRFQLQLDQLKHILIRCFNVDYITVPITFIIARNVDSKRVSEKQAAFIQRLLVNMIKKLYKIKPPFIFYLL